MKKQLLIMLFFGLGAIVLSPSKATAGEPVWNQAFPDSSYTISNSTVAITSDTVKTFAAVQYYREVTLDNQIAGAVTTYYTLDGSTGAITIRNIGLVILPGNKAVIESNGVVNIIQESGTTTRNLKVQTKRKSR